MSQKEIQEAEAKLAALKEKEQRKLDRAQAKQDKVKKAYELKRDKRISAIVQKAIAEQDRLQKLKDDVDAKMTEALEDLEQYSKLNGNSKGGFSLRNSDDNMMIKRIRRTNPTWDERGEKGVEMVKEFISEKLKESDPKTYNVLMVYIEKNSKGDLEYQRVMRLFQLENQYSDPRWKEGLKMIKEGYKNNFKKYGYEVHIRNKANDWDKVELNFSAL